MAVVSKEHDADLVANHHVGHRRHALLLVTSDETRQRQMAGWASAVARDEFRDSCSAKLGMFSAPAVAINPNATNPSKDNMRAKFRSDRELQALHGAKVKHDKWK